MPSRSRPALLLCACLLAAVPASSVDAAPPTPSFERDVRPILKAYCLDCHGAAEKVRGKLDLRLRRFLVKGGASGPAVVPGNAAGSLLLARLKTGEMPPTEKKVPAEQVAIIARWIAAGAPTLRDEPEKLSPGIDITPEERAYWFYQPIRRPPTPRFGPGDRVRTPIDAFILARLKTKGLSFNPDADRLTLVRRASLDLTGLPPDQRTIDDFLADNRPDAYERMLDRLLASPGYGERWGRHWLDVAGYADSDGGTADTPRPHAWKYRDWVIRALNADLPLDQFVIEQLAGDELVTPPWNNLKPEQIERLTATGFLRMVPDTVGGQAEAEQVLADTLKVVGSSLLGLTVGCAQCHDHRYDPIPQADYYRLRAIFEPALSPARWRTPPSRRLSLYSDADRARAAAVEAQAAKLQAEHDKKQAAHVRAAFDRELEKFPAGQRAALRAAFTTPPGKRSAEQQKLVAGNPKLNITPGVLYQYNQGAADELKKLQAVIAAKRAEKPVEDFIAVLNEVPGQVPVTRIFHRGDYRQPKGAVAPGDLTIAAPDGKRFEIAARGPKLASTGRRLAFARHLTSGSHPLLGRVLVNRVWLGHFGRGIVDTPGDFGMLGQRPTHPELLDWLACELVGQAFQPDAVKKSQAGKPDLRESQAGKPDLRKSQAGKPDLRWSLKRLHRLIMTSTVYRQSSRRDSAKDRSDGGNELHGRYPLRRLEAEVIRDRILAAAGRLDRTLFGPPVPVVEDTVGQVDAPDDRPRRSIYLQVRRSKPVAFLGAFDGPSCEVNCDRRGSSTVAPQALMLMNSKFIRDQSAHFARRLYDQAPGGLRQRVALAWQLAYQRPASRDEVDLGCRFVQRQTDLLRGAHGAAAERAALTNLCQQLLASNEFLHVD